ncbi:MAG: hypothetical protein ACRD0K_21200 [Egibacteraceae bacterium]
MAEQRRRLGGQVALGRIGGVGGEADALLAIPAAALRAAVAR